MKKLALLMLFSLFAIGSMTMPALAAEKGLSPGDKLFIKDAASGGMMEVQLGQVAQEKGKIQEVKDYGKRMVIDHGNAGDELKEIAAKKNVKLPAQPELKHKLMVAKLSKLPGDKFDKKYVQAMLKDNARDLAHFKKATRKLKDPDLNAWVVRTLPVLEQHLQQAKDVAQKLGVRVK